MNGPYNRREAGTGLIRALPHNPGGVPLATGTKMVSAMSRPVSMAGKGLSGRGAVPDRPRTAIILTYPGTPPDGAPGHKS
jgi:hypothetical protein